jgi:hypothetical protein
MREEVVEFVHRSKSPCCHRLTYTHAHTHTHIYM